MLNKSIFISESRLNDSFLTRKCLESLNNINATINTSELSKIKHLLEVLNKVKELKDINYVIFSCDIFYIKKNAEEWNQLETYLLNNNKDMYFFRLPNSSFLNSDFFIIKNNKNINLTIKFFKEVLQQYQHPNLINELKNKINYGVIPPEYVVFGNTIYNKDKCLIHYSESVEQIDRMESELLSE
jgi:hypothetical protein